MELIAKKPCQFCGKQFFIGEAIPKELVSDPALQERLGVLSIVPDNGEILDSPSACIYTQEQVNHMLDKAIEEAVNNTIMEMEQKQGELSQMIEEGVLLETEGLEIYDKTIPIAVIKGNDGEDAQGMAVPATPEEIQQVFSIMQMNAAEGAEAITGVESEHVLILLHAADSRKTIKDAAKKQADNLFSHVEDSNESAGGNETEDIALEGG